jgi:HD-GYP domain-containing protein (c-di-GMP phosphodiesterase class II)/DNA-binding SARP family transcriptional activator
MGKIELHYAVNEASELSSSEMAEDEISLKALAEWITPFSGIVNKMKRMEDLEEKALSAYDRMIEAWSAAIETREKKASGHIKYITEMALELAREMGFDEDDLPNIRRGALLHDIGKLGIPDDIILKPGRLTEDEFQVVKKYPQYAEEWLSEIEILQPAMEIPYFHNERWDGTGYPRGLKGEEIPLSARMFAVVNVWDALISDRPYRKAMSKEEALDLIVSESGSHFDPDVVESFLHVLSRGDYIDTSYEIKIQAFGQERVWVQNRLVTTKDWQVSAAEDLFFLLLAHPEGLTKEQVGLYMWPDVSPDDLNVRFKNTLYRLRKAVGNQAILLGNHGYLFNRMLDYFYDVETFTTLIKKAEEAADVLQKVTYLNKAIREYQGDYLANSDGLWVMADREGYRQMYLKALVQLAEFHYEEQELQAALRYCQQALIEDPMLEEIHRLAMKIHAMSGNRAEVIRQYQLCKRVLIDNYNISPSEKTHELYNSLINS